MPSESLPQNELLVMIRAMVGDLGDVIGETG